MTDVFYTLYWQTACPSIRLPVLCRVCIAPTMVSDGLMHYQKVDLPMGEFWLNSPAR